MAQAGQKIGGRYRLERRLGEGGMGEVWKARDEKLEVDVAVKQVRLNQHASPVERAKAIAYADSEAKNAAALRDHPNVVTVYDVVTETGMPWLVMRLVDGRSVEQMLEPKKGGRRVRLHPDEAGKIAAGVLEALRAAHNAKPQIVHRDVKPANIMVTRDGHVLLTDFGISKDLSSSTRLTSTGMLVGSVAYMAPERFAGRPDAPAVDLWAVGAILFEMAEGFSPFQRVTNLATMNAIGNEPAPPATHAGRLAPLIAALLDKNPKNRPNAERALAMLRGRGGEPTQTMEQSPGSVLKILKARLGDPVSPRSTLPDNQTGSRRGQQDPLRPWETTAQAENPKSPLLQEIKKRKRAGPGIAIGLFVSIGGGLAAMIWALTGPIRNDFHDWFSNNAPPTVECTVLPTSATDPLGLKPGVTYHNYADSSAGQGCEWDDAVGTTAEEKLRNLVVIGYRETLNPAGSTPLAIGIPDSYEQQSGPSCSVSWKTSFGYYYVGWGDPTTVSNDPAIFNNMRILLCPKAENIAKQLYPNLKR